MKAEDTIISLDEYNQISLDWHIRNGLAEIYIKADSLGREFVFMLQTQAKKAHRRGMEEVVDWVDKHTYPIYRPYSGGSQVFCSEDWDIQLKEWGL